MDRHERVGAPHDLEVDDTLRKLVVGFRILAWAWMLILVVVTLAVDDEANRAIVVGAMVVATVQVAVTWWGARAGFLGSPVFVVVDGGISLTLATLSIPAGTDEFFHGGMPMSWILVAAYAYGIRGATPAALLLAVDQVIVHVLEERGLVGAIGSLVFVVFGVAVGWAFDALRDSEVRRRDVESQLRVEQRERARHEERSRLADQLHDSVLQSLLVMRRDADDPQQVRYLARRETRELRRAIADLRSSHVGSFRAEMLKVCDDVEDTHRVEIESVIRDDLEMTDGFEAALGATREALVNAAKHSGCTRIDLYAEAGGSQLTIYVRDQGRGFDSGSRKSGGGMDRSLLERMERVGGTAVVRSVPGQGTEVMITLGTAGQG